MELGEDTRKSPAAAADDDGGSVFYAQSGGELERWKERLLVA